MIPHESIVRVYEGPEEGLSLEIYKKLENLTHCAIVIDEATNRTVDQSDWKSVFKGAGNAASNQAVFSSTFVVKNSIFLRSDTDMWID